RPSQDGSVNPGVAQFPVLIEDHNWRVLQRHAKTLFAGAKAFVRFSAFSVVEVGTAFWNFRRGSHKTLPFLSVRSKCFGFYRILRFFSAESLIGGHLLAPPLWLNPSRELNDILWIAIQEFRMAITAFPTFSLPYKTNPKSAKSVPPSS